MSFAVLEEQVRSLPEDLQASIELYATFIIERYNKDKRSSGIHKTGRASEIIDHLTGIIGSDAPLSIKDIRAERLGLK